MARDSVREDPPVLTTAVGVKFIPPAAVKRARPLIFVPSPVLLSHAVSTCGFDPPPTDDPGLNEPTDEPTQSHPDERGKKQTCTRVSTVNFEGRGFRML